MTGIFIAFIFMLWIRYAFQGAKIDLLDFDVSTITAGDYTVEIKFSSENKEYQTWYDNVYVPEHKGKGKSVALALKEQLRSEIELIIKSERTIQDDPTKPKILKKRSDEEQEKYDKKMKNKEKKLEKQKKKKQEKENAAVS